jgi:lysophospholipase L1-like esterase
MVIKKKYIFIFIVILIIVFFIMNYMNIIDYLAFFFSKIIPFEHMRFNSDYYLEELKKYETENSSIDGIVTVFLGDSITYDFDISYFKDSNILNRSIKGDTTLGILNRLDTNINNLNIDTLFLMIGVNDLKFRNDEEIISNIILIVQSIAARRIIIHSIIPLDESRIWFNKRIIIINSRLKQYCNNNVFTFIDLHPDFINSNNGIKKELTRDGTHLNSEGYSIWYSLLSGFF